jgi:hypothetical protein
MAFILTKMMPVKFNFALRSYDNIIDIEFVLQSKILEYLAAIDASLNYMPYLSLI